VKSRHVQCKPPCPLHPRKRTRALQLAMSAKGQKRTFVATKLPATAILAHLVDEALFLLFCFWRVLPCSRGPRRNRLWIQSMSLSGGDRLRIERSIRTASLFSRVWRQNLTAGIRFARRDWLGIECSRVVCCRCAIVALDH